jgi:hypothetical protein
MSRARDLSQQRVADRLTAAAGHTARTLAQHGRRRTHKTHSSRVLRCGETVCVCVCECVYFIKNTVSL